VIFFCFVVFLFSVSFRVLYVIRFLLVGSIFSSCVCIVVFFCF